MKCARWPLISWLRRVCRGGKEHSYIKPLMHNVFRARDEAESLTKSLTDVVDQRCQELIGEGNDACNDVLGQITDRYNEIVEGATIEETQRLTLEMVRRGAESAFDSQLELGKQLAEAMFKE